MEGEDEQHVQGDVDQGGDDQPDHRRPAVPQGAEDARAEVVEERGGKPGEDGDNINIGAVVDVRRGVHGCEDNVAEKHRGGSEGRADDEAQPYAAGGTPAQLLVVLRAEVLGHRDGEAAAHAGAEAHHQEVDGPGGAHCRQGRAPQGLAHDGGVHHVVELLEQVSKQHRNAEAEDQPHGAALGEIFCHSRYLKLYGPVGPRVPPEGGGAQET